MARLNKLLCVVLSVLLVASLVPAAALAEALDETQELAALEADEQGDDAAPQDDVAQQEEAVPQDDAAPEDDAAPQGDVPLEEPPTEGEPVLLEALSQEAAVLPEAHTEDEIRAYMESHPFNIKQAASYAQNPQTSAPYNPGILSSDSAQQALNALTVMRYVAGVSYDIALDDEFSTRAQAGALLQSVADELSHTPKQPSDMSDELYQTCIAGTSNSNISRGCTNPCATILDYMDDLGTENENIVGHRRWILSWGLGAVGFGHVGAYSDTYITDMSGSGTPVSEIAWPARTMPTCLMSTEAQWSFSVYGEELPTYVEVSVMRRRDGKTWNLSSDNGVAINRSNYGSNGATIIWSMDGAGPYLDGDVYDVTIGGPYMDKRYSVSFFDLYKSDTLDAYVEGTPIADGQTLAKSAASPSFDLWIVPGFSYLPEDEGLQTLALLALEYLSTTFSSTNEDVATAVNGNSGTYYNRNGILVRGDRMARVTPADKGTAAITATLADGRMLTVKLEVTGKSINPSVDANASVSFTQRYVESSGITYDGTEKRPALTISYANMGTLTEGFHYSVDYRDNLNAGTATAVITGMGSFEGTSYEKTFRITPRSITSASFVFPRAQEYTGKPLTPKPRITALGKTLVEDVDYTLSYANNIYPGEATLTITGIGNFTDTKQTTFSITGSGVVFPVAQEGLVYTGSEQVGVAEGTGYTLSGDWKATEAGTYLAYATLASAGSTWVDGTTAPKAISWMIDRASIEDAVVQAPDQVYDGTAKKPTVTVTLHDRTLVAGTDYTVTYGSNVNAGTAHVTVTGKGYYQGTASGSFTIARVPIAVPVAKEGLVYTGYEQTGVSGGVGYTLAGTASATEARSYTVRATPDANHQWTDGSTATKSIRWVIAGASISGAKVSAEGDQVYDGTAKKPAVTVTLQGKTLAESDYTVAYSNNTKAGNATITVRGVGNYAGNATGSFEIAPATLAIPQPVSGLVYNGSTQTGLMAGNGYGLSGTTSAIAAGTYKPKATLNDSANYRWADGTTEIKTVPWTIAPADIAQAVIEPFSTQTYTGDPVEPKTTITYDGMTLREYRDYTMSYKDNVMQGTGTATIAGVGNYSGSVEIKFAILANVATVPVAQKSLVYTGTAQVGVLSGVGYTLSGHTGTGAGSYAATATLREGYTWSDGTTAVKRIAWSIAPANLQSAQVSAAAQVYDGTEKKPAATVLLDGTKLTAGTDYTVTYGSNINAGTAHITVTGKGNYEGSASGSFTIARARISVPSARTGLVYSASTQTGVAEGNEYSLQGQVSAVDAGGYVAKATPEANYQWTDGSVATKSISWSIASAPISKATVAPVGNQQYTGKDIKPEPVVSFSGKQLVRGTDYTLAYRNNTNVGTATITIMGMGNFSGTSEVSFKIVKESVATQDMYRLYNPNSGEHFYTANSGERDHLVGLGWKYEGVGWVAPLEGADVYRMYNKNGGEHHYTTDAAERDNLLRMGWTYEGVGWKSGGSVRLYRDYNPNAFANNHNYTANKAEHDMLVRVGWKAEGYAWNGVEGGRSA